MNSEKRVSEVKLEKLENARFIRPFCMRFKHGDRERRWELLKVHDSVAVMIYNKEDKKLVFVRQFRPAVFVANYAAKHGIDLETVVHKDLYASGATKELIVGEGEQKMGMTMELCAGIVDKKATSREIAVSEVFEETGYTIECDDLEEINSFKSGVGTAASTQTLFYVEVVNSQRTGSGGGLATEGESIEVLHLSEEETQQMLGDKAIDKPLGLIYALQWRRLKLSGLS